MRSAALLAAAGLAVGAQAQTGSAMWLANVIIADDHKSVECTLSVSMEADAQFVALWNTTFDTLNTAGAQFGSITGWEVLNNLDVLFGDLTTTDGDSLFGTHAAQLTVFGPFTSANPIDVLTFSWEAAESYDIAEGGEPVLYETSTEAMVLHAGEDKESVIGIDVTDNLTDVSFGWGVIPTPASTALLGLGVLVLARRRR